MAARGVSWWTKWKDRTWILRLLAELISSPLGRVEVHTVRLVGDRAVPAFKESGAITSMAHADGYLEIPADVGVVEKGERVRVTLF